VGEISTVVDKKPRGSSFAKFKFFPKRTETILMNFCRSEKFGSSRAKIGPMAIWEYAALMIKK
jgi:hypothetical protein